MTLSAVQRPGLISRLRSLAEQVTTPLLPEHYVELFDPLAVTRQLRGRIVAIHPETPDAATIVIRPGRTWRGHVPGQYLRLGVDVNGVRLWRNYSLTCPPGTGDISITVKAIPDGVVSNYLVREARPGLLVHLDQAAGEFVLPAARPAKVLFVTGGSGITPVMGILRSHRDLRDVVVLHSAPSKQDVIFGTELRALAKAGRIQLIEIHNDRDGILDIGTDLERLVPDWRERTTWACGPAGLLAAVEEHVRDAIVERFRPLVIDADAKGGAVTLTRSTIEFEAEGNRPLLEQAEEAGALMPFGCRMGVCYGCVVPLRSGAVRDLRDGAVTIANPDDGVLVQTCINAAAGPCEIEV